MIKISRVMLAVFLPPLAKSAPKSIFLISPVESFVMLLPGVSRLRSTTCGV